MVYDCFNHIIRIFSYGECKLPLMRLAQRTDDSGKVPFCKLISSDGEEISGVPWSETLETRVEHGEKPWENEGMSENGVYSQL